jgi:hypothetical protein
MTETQGTNSTTPRPTSQLHHQDRARRAPDQSQQDQTSTLAGGAGAVPQFDPLQGMSLTPGAGLEPQGQRPGAINQLL